MWEDAELLTVSFTDGEFCMLRDCAKGRIVI